MSSFIYTSGEKRFHTLDWELKTLFGKKTVKIPLDAGLGCPNRDGTRGNSGCSFCSSSRSGEFAGDCTLPIAKQFEEQKKLYSKWQDALYIPYFQAGSNTYAPVDTLRRLYYEALFLDGVVGLSIATRPDCISDEALDLLAEISGKTYLTVELGLQSAKNQTLAAISRGHTYEEFLQGYQRLTERGIKVCVHIINGLPGETREDMLDTVRKLSMLGIYEIKIHLLHILAGTRLEKEYTEGKFKTLDYDEYIDIVCEQLRLLPPETVVARLTGDGDRRTLIAPLWSLDKRSVLNGIDKRMRSLDAYQGDRLAGIASTPQYPTFT